MEKIDDHASTAKLVYSATLLQEELNKTNGKKKSKFEEKNKRLYWLDLGRFLGSITGLYKFKPI
jgi:hypothetical protein